MQEINNRLYERVDSLKAIEIFRSFVSLFLLFSIYFSMRRIELKLNVTTASQKYSSQSVERMKVFYFVSF